MVGKGSRTGPVADYILEGPDGDDWRDWLLSHQVELNAMTSPQFLAWLDRKFSSFAGKVIPPPAVLALRLEADTKAAVEGAFTRRILASADLTGQVNKAMRRLAPAIRAQSATLPGTVTSALANAPGDRWTGPVAATAARIAGAVNGRDGSNSETRGVTTPGSR